MDFMENLIDTEIYFNKIRQFENIILFGAGSKGLQTIEILRNINIFPKAFVDNNPGMWGKDCAGIPVLSYEELIKKYKRYCILITCVYQNATEIYEMLKLKEDKNPAFFVCNPYKAETRFLTLQEIEEQKENLSITYDVLCDNTSKEIFVQFLNYKMTGDISQLAAYTEGNWLEFFDCNLLPKRDNYTYIDVGAYTGDSIIRFLSFCQGKYEKIIGFEPNEANFLIAKQLIDSCRLENIELLQSGLWMKKEKKKFFSTGFSYESSNFFRENKIDKNSSDVIIQVDTLDHQLETPSYQMMIKIDALASEVPILYGACNIIKTYKPVIIMEYGTRSIYMANTIPYLLKLNPNYRFYLRQMYVFNNSRTILYVI